MNIQIRSILLFVLFLSSIIGCNKEIVSVENDVSKMKLKGSVKSMERVVYKENNNINNEVKKYSLKESYSFDSSGRKIEHLILENDGRFKSKTKREFENSGKIGSIIMYDSIGDIYLYMINNYDINGFLVEYKSYMSNGELLSKVRFENNEKGDLVKRIVFDKGIENYKEIFDYDKNGNKIERKLYSKNSKGKFYLGFLSSFDSLGNEIEEITYDSKGIIEKKGIKEYNSKGNLIESKFFDYESNNERKITHKFDKNNNRIERCIYRNDVLIKKNQYKYDNKGNEIEESVFDSNGILYHIKKHRYDEYRNPIESIFETPTNKNIPKHDYSWEYEYDKNKNWIKSIMYINNEPFQTIERKIEYY